jgi:hypothetical protein
MVDTRERYIRNVSGNNDPGDGPEMSVDWTPKNCWLPKLTVAVRPTPRSVGGVRRCQLTNARYPYITAPLKFTEEWIMKTHAVATASIVAIALAATMASVSASGQSPAPDRTTVDRAASTQKPVDTPQPTSPQFATLKNVKAAPMASAELDAVKGTHIHFVTPSGSLHLVNHLENNLGKGQALPGSGPGYSGLCTAAIQSPAIVIPGPGGTTIGIGSGC